MVKTNIKPGVIYNLPNTKTYYKWSGSKEFDWEKDRHMFQYWNKFGDGYTWKDDIELMKKAIEYLQNAKKSPDLKTGGEPIQAQGITNHPMTSLK